MSFGSGAIGITLTDLEVTPPKFPTFLPSKVFTLFKKHGHVSLSMMDLTS